MQDRKKQETRREVVKENINESSNKAIKNALLEKGAYYTQKQQG